MGWPGQGGARGGASAKVLWLGKVLTFSAMENEAPEAAGWTGAGRGMREQARGCGGPWEKLDFTAHAVGTVKGCNQERAWSFCT